MQLTAGPAQATLDPDRGAGIVALSLAGQPILSTGAGRPADSPFAQGMNLLLPFSNRISRPFAFADRTHAVPANLPGEPFAIHGDGFQRAWTVDEQGPDRARLILSGGIGPWAYQASVTYVLSPGGLDCALTMTNRAAVTLPFGGGFHPWFPRQSETRLGFRATGHWPQDARHLPATTGPVPAPPDLGFDPPGPLPAGWINTAFSGWDGTARIRQPGLNLSLTARGCDTLILYSPAADAPFFCVEPVSHPVDAHNLPGQPGLVPLAPGESLTLTLSLAWTAPEGDPA